MRFPDDKEEVEELDSLDEELSGALDEASTVVDGAPPPKESNLSTILEILVLGSLFVMAGGGLYFGYTAKMTADKALVKMEEMEKSSGDAYTVTLALQKEVKDIGEQKIRQLGLDIDQASSAARSQFSQLQRDIKELRKALKPQPPRVVVRREPVPSSPAPAPTPTPSAPKPTPRTPKPAAPAPTPPDDRFYEIKSGDTLGDIAKKYGISVQEIQKLNPNVDARRLQIGQKIKLRR